MKPTQLRGFETFWRENSRERPLILGGIRGDLPSQWISYSNGFPIPMDFLFQWISYSNGFLIPVDSLSQRIPWGCCVGFFVFFFSVGFFLGWEVIYFFFKKQSKNHLNFVPGNSQDLIAKMAPLHQFSPWIDPVTHS